MMTYQSFDLMILPVMGDTVGSYQARVLDSPSGQASIHFTLPTELDPWQGNLQLVGGAIRAFQFDEEEDARVIQPLDPQQFGEILFTTIFRAGIAEVFHRSLAITAQQAEGLRIRLWLDETPELAALPWEYLYDPSRRKFLALTDETPLVRYLSLPQAEVPLAVARPLRMLVLTAEAKDFPQLNVAAEQVRLSTAIGPLEGRGDVEITWLPNGTLRDLRQTLRQNDYHLFHFIGHGWFDEAQQTHGLLLVDETGNGAFVPADVMSMTLQNHRSLRLAFLNACEGARLVEGEPFGGVAQHLVQQGLPAVIAMQFPVTDAAAIELTREFYSALADQYPVDTALAQARIAIYSLDSVMEWGTPVLFMRAEDGRLWQPEEEAIMNNSPVSSTGSDTGSDTGTNTEINTGGDAYISSNVQVDGAFIGPDKIVHGDEVKGDKVMGDKFTGDKVMGNKVEGHKADGDVIVTTVGAGASNVAAGKNITQNNMGTPTADDKALIEAQLAQVTAAFQQIKKQLDSAQIPMIEFQLQLLQGELTKTADGESPSAATITQVGGWLLDNVPALGSIVRTLFTLPAVAKVLVKAGPSALEWQERRF